MSVHEPLTIDYELHRSIVAPLEQHVEELRRHVHSLDEEGWKEVSWTHFKTNDYGAVINAGYDSSKNPLPNPVKVVVGDSSVIYGELIYIVTPDGERRGRDPHQAEIIPDGFSDGVCFPIYTEYQREEDGPWIIEEHENLRVFVR